MDILDTDNTSDDSPLRLWIENSGNTVADLVNLTVGSSLWDSALGGLGAGFAIGSVIADAGRKVADFDQKVANLASITGKSRSQMSALTQNAKDVGAVSAFSASQVLELQTELAKLGNTEGEIISMTKAVGDFSIAVGASTSAAATLAGGALKSFGSHSLLL